jgi:hypothetical protein
MSDNFIDTRVKSIASHDVKHLCRLLPLPTSHSRVIIPVCTGLVFVMTTIVGMVVMPVFPWLLRWSARKK